MLRSLAIAVATTAFLSSLALAAVYSPYHPPSYKPVTTFVYPMSPREVIDGDTFRADIYLGFDLLISDVKCRLAGCDAYELTDPQGRGRRAQELAQKYFLSNGPYVIVSEGKRDSFGRALVWVFNSRKKSLSESLRAWDLTTGRYNRPIPPVWTPK